MAGRICGLDTTIIVDISDVITIIQDGNFDEDEIEEVAKVLLSTDNGFEILEKINEIRKKDEA
jgi:hypothetical protein